MNNQQPTLVNYIRNDEERVLLLDCTGEDVLLDRTIKNRKGMTSAFMKFLEDKGKAGLQSLQKLCDDLSKTKCDSWEQALKLLKVFEKKWRLANTECPDDFEAFEDSEETGEDAPADINPSPAAVDAQDTVPFDEAPTNIDLKLQLLTKVALLLLQKIGGIKFVAALGRDASTVLDVQGKKKTITVDSVRIKVGYVPHPSKLLYDMTTFTRWCKRQEEWDSGVEHPKQWGEWMCYVTN
ncbi:hypothetical protein HDV05_004260 [Chytridiales sp. JEL 0842]|nr:hypothetical protein HDV05_004260 [Chytridiales sp. JEL 0842]